MSKKKGHVINSKQLAKGTINPREKTVENRIRQIHEKLFQIIVTVGFSSASRSQLDT